MLLTFGGEEDVSERARGRAFKTVSLEVSPARKNIRD
jgi:hypothetical protein